MNHLDDQLFDLALGALPAAEAALAEAHLVACARCVDELSSVRELVSTLPLALPPTAPRPQVLARLLAAVAAPSRFAAFTDEVARILDVAAARARQLLGLIDDPSAWLPGFTADITLVHFDGGPRVQGCATGFVRLPSGATFPTHTHLGEEHNLVLGGQLLDDDGRLYRPGEIVHHVEGSTHSFRAVGDEDCIVVAVLRGGLEIAGQTVRVTDPTL